jgi:hypothetical protein
MSAKSEGTGDEPDVSPGSCRNAEEYALRRLEGEAGAVQPAEIAGEYGCTPGHMRRALNNLRESGDVVRVGHGQYTSKNGDSTESEQPDESVPALPAQSGEDDRPSGDGPAHSGDHDGQAGDREDGSMPTEEEMERQREQYSEGNENVDEDGEQDDVDGGEDTDDLGGDPEPVEVEVEAVDEIEAGGGAGIPIPVSTTTLFGGVALFLILVFLLRSGSSGGSDQTAEDQEEPADDGLIPPELVEEV